MAYLFTHEDKAERERLAAIEAGLDPFTIDFLQTIGVAEGWTCLEVGAGAGSVFGAMAGGIWGGMGQARREEGFLVEVHTDDPDEARRIAEILGRHRPIRLDRTAFDRGLGSV